MLVFLLKNGRLRLPVCLLVLVIGTGLLPEKAGAIKCHFCDGDDCMTFLVLKTKSCPASNYCHWHVGNDGTALRSCSNNIPDAKCYLHLKGGCTSADTTDPGYSAYQSCRKNLRREGTEKTGSSELTGWCFCQGDLCNSGTEPTIVKWTPTPGGSPNPPGPNPTKGSGGDDGDGPAPTDEDVKKSGNGRATGGPFPSFNTFGVLFFAVLGALVSTRSVMVRP